VVQSATPYEKRVTVLRWSFQPAEFGCGKKPLLGKKITTHVLEWVPFAPHVSFSPEPPTPHKQPALLARERVDIGWVASGSAVRVDAFLPAPFSVAVANGLAAALVDLATCIALEGVIDPEDDDDRRTAGGGSSSPDGPDESLRKVCLRFTTFGGGIETAVETVGFFELALVMCILATSRVSHAGIRVCFLISTKLWSHLPIFPRLWFATDYFVPCLFERDNANPCGIVDVADRGKDLPQQIPNKSSHLFL
jgi:hypothetical protein